LRLRQNKNKNNEQTKNVFSSSQRSDHQPLPVIRLQMTDDLPAADQSAVKKSETEKKEKKKKKGAA
jgi:hypothetical protein